MQRSLLLAFALAVLSAGPASATSVSFDCLSNSNKCAVGEDQLSVEVLAGAAGQVAFLLHNEGDEPLSVAQVFFDDVVGVLGDLLSIVSGAGVDFDERGKPDNLKGGKKIGFVPDDFASATKPTKENGVDPGEDLLITFELGGTNTLEDVIEALEFAGLRIGINAKKGYVSATSVPEPGALTLLALGLCAAAWSARRLPR